MKSVGVLLALVGICLMVFTKEWPVNISDMLSLLWVFGFACYIFFTSIYVKGEDLVLLTLT